MHVISEALAAKNDCRAVILNYTKGGIPFWNDVLMSPLRDRRGQVLHYVGVQRNIPEPAARRIVERMGAVSAPSVDQKSA